MIWVVVVTAALTFVAVVIGLNFVPPEKQLERELKHITGVRDPQFFREMSTLLGPTILAGNRIVPLDNGDEIFPAMLQAIRGAKRSITFETYIYWSGEIGEQFAEALEERARAGVKVHVLLDWVGSQKIDDEMLDAMRKSGIEIERYHPLHWYTLGRMNNRTHRKLLVVDGRIGFTGGVGIADQWTGHAQDPDHWRDTHFRAEGPVVAQIQSVFIDNWITTSGKVLRGPDYFPPLEAVGDTSAQMFSSSPDGGSESMHLMYLMAITSAEKTIDIAASYLVPDELTKRALLDALQRGVRVRLVLPGEHIDTDVVRSASRAQWGALLEAGAEIHEFRPTMYHNKIFIVDGYLVAVGSTNFDNRSFSLNDEANLNVYENAFAARMTESFERDLAQSRRITLEDWQHRPWRERAMDKLASLFKSQL
ncbi:MAG TPA: phospholipase D-like domain-containing protein [Xanthomonadales bacterium]|nr:phospholipase D-like domain-containing protein [Xanthomonadales bacterium]